jgi:hypothetical protein
MDLHTRYPMQPRTRTRSSAADPTPNAAARSRAFLRRGPSLADDSPERGGCGWAATRAARQLGQIPWLGRKLPATSSRVVIPAGSFDLHQPQTRCRGARRPRGRPRSRSRRAARVARLAARPAASRGGVACR